MQLTKIWSKHLKKKRNEAAQFTCISSFLCMDWIRGLRMLHADVNRAFEMSSYRKMARKWWTDFSESLM